MSVFSKRNLLVGLATILIGIGAAAAIWGMPKFLKRNTSVTSQVTVFLLDDRGAINGLLLASGDQIRFSPQTGAAVAAQIKVGDQVTVIGQPGSQSGFGREIRVKQISANGRTIVEVQAGPPRPHGPHDKAGPGSREERGAEPGVSNAPAAVGTEEGPVPAVAEPNRAPASDPNPQQIENNSPAPLPTPEVFKVTGTIRAHLVNGHGDVDGLVLSSGEQVRFSPKLGKLLVAAEQGTTTPISVDGTGVRKENGTVIRPTRITVGTQTFTVGH